MKILRDKITVDSFIVDKQKELKLTLVSGREGLGREIKTNLLACPGLVLSGYKKYFKEKTIQIIGIQVMKFLKNLDEDSQKDAVNNLVTHKIPCIVVTDCLKIPSVLKNACREKKIPLIKSSLKQGDLVHQVLDYIEMKTAPYIYCHGALVDVYGIGVLFTGKSGIGKSETALDLVARGHRLVADDVVKITRRSFGILMGEGKQPVDFFHSHVEIRGIGVIDLSKVFGVRATRLHKRVEVEVNLVKWGEKVDVERTGLEVRTKSILGVKIPFRVIPLVPGKNVSVISEMVAVEHLLKLYAIDTPKIFNKRLLEMMKKRGEKFAQLDRDIE
jgi:HPr kinase/phosphorylase